jgi:hypothetical protein
LIRKATAEDSPTRDNIFQGQKEDPNLKSYHTDTNGGVKGVGSDPTTAGAPVNPEIAKTSDASPTSASNKPSPGLQNKGDSSTFTKPDGSTGNLKETFKDANNPNISYNYYDNGTMVEKNAADGSARAYNYTTDPATGNRLLGAQKNGSSAVADLAKPDSNGYSALKTREGMSFNSSPTSNQGGTNSVSSSTSTSQYTPSVPSQINSLAGIPVSTIDSKTLNSQFLYPGAGPGCSGGFCPATSPSFCPGGNCSNQRVYRPQ